MPTSKINYTTPTVTQVAYTDAQTRGLLRAWKVELAKKYGDFDRAHARLSRDMTPVGEFIYRNSQRGRFRALKRLRAILGPAVTLEAVRIDGSPLALWSILKPRSSVMINAAPETGLMQDCVTVNYLLIGILPDRHNMAEGTWTMEIPDHALGRCIHRTGFMPDKFIREAHLNVLKLNTNLVLHDNGTRFNSQHRFRVRAGDGGFVCTFRIAAEISRNELMAHVRADTWIAEEDTGYQGFLTGNGLPGNRLIDNWLVPAPLRRIDLEGDGEVQLVL